MGAKIATKKDETTLVNAMKMMFKNIKSGDTIYLAFSRKSFYILIFVLTIGTAANIALIDILLHGSGYGMVSNTSIVYTQLILSVIAIVSGIWLFFKGINVAVD